jgi:hypothetical protein
VVGRAWLRCCGVGQMSGVSAAFGPLKQRFTFLLPGFHLMEVLEACKVMLRPQVEAWLMVWCKRRSLGRWRIFSCSCSTWGTGRRARLTRCSDGED